MTSKTVNFNVDKSPQRYTHSVKFLSLDRSGWSIFIKK